MKRSRRDALLAPLLILLPLQALFAGSATWNLNPTSGDWNTAANWTPATVPNNPADAASFGTSNHEQVTVSEITDVAGSVLNPGASAFGISVASKQEKQLLFGRRGGDE